MSDFIKLECKVIEVHNEIGLDEAVLCLQVADEFGGFPATGGKIIYVRVATFNGLVKAGCCGKYVQITGNWINQYRTRFDVYSAVLFRPQDGVQTLMSLLNLTVREATKILDIYGPKFSDIFDNFDNNPKTIKEIKGLGGYGGDMIIERWQECRDSILFYFYCIKYNAPAQTMNAIWARYGKGSLRVLQSATIFGLFKLCEIPEVSYYFIERLAFEIGCTVDNEYRLAAQDLPGLYDNQKKKYAFDTTLQSNDVTAAFGRTLIHVCHPEEMADIRFWKLYVSSNVIQEQLPVLLNPDAPKHISVYGYFSEYMKFYRPHAFPQIFAESIAIIRQGDIVTHLRHVLQIPAETCDILMEEIGFSFPEVFRTSPEKIRAIAGLSAREADNVIQKWSAYRGIYELCEKYQPLRVSNDTISTLNAELGPNAVAIIASMSIEEIYDLMYIQGTDFRSVDIIALDRGIDRDSHVRVRALCIWASWLAAWQAGKYGADRISFRQIHWFGMSLEHPATEAAISATLGIMHAAGEVEYLDDTYEGSSVQLFRITLPPWRRKPR